MSITKSPSPMRVSLLAAAVLSVASAAIAQAPATPAPADQAAAPAAAPAPLTTPAVTGPLAWLPPANFDAGPFGKISANGIVTGFGRYQDNHIPGLVWGVVLLVSVAMVFAPSATRFLKPEL